MKLKTPLDFERALLTKMAVSGDAIAEVLHSRFTVRNFHDTEHAAVFNQITDHYVKHGKAPGRDLIETYFPSFRFIKSATPAAGLIDELRERQIHVDLAAFLEELRIALDGRQPSEVYDEYINRFAEIGQASAQASAVHTLSSSMMSIWSGYEEAKNAQGITGIPWPWPTMNDATMGIHPEEYIVITARPKTGKCVRRDTEITDAKSGKRMTVQEFVEQGHSVLTLSSDLQTQRVEPSAYLNDGKRYCYRVTTATGRTVSVTAEHPLLRDDGVWMKCKDLSVGDRIGVPSVHRTFGKKRMPFHVIEMLGLMLAEGHVRPVGEGSSDISFTNTDPKLVEMFINAASKMDCSVTRFGRGGIQYRPVMTARARYQVNPVRTLCDEAGIACPSHLKRFPSVIWEQTRERLAHFIGVVWSCDGSVSKSRPVMEFGVASESLARDMLHALSRFGVFASIRFKENRGRGAWVVDVRGENVARFQKEIPLFGAKDKVLLRMKFPFKWRNRANEGDVVWDRIVSIEEDGLHQVYDLMIPETHNFIAGDVCLHNTWFMEVLAAWCFNMGYRVLFKTIEMAVPVIFRRMASILCGLPYTKWRSGTLSDAEESRALETLQSIKTEAENDLVVVGREPGDDQLRSLRSHCERLRPDVVFIDGVYLLAARRVEDQTELSTKVKDLTGAIKVPVFASTQLNRKAGQSKDTQLEWVAFADAYGQDADLHLALRRGHEEKARDHLRIDLPAQRESDADKFSCNWMLCTDFSEVDDVPDISTMEEDDDSDDTDD